MAAGSGAALVGHLTGSGKGKAGQICLEHAVLSFSTSPSTHMLTTACKHRAAAQPLPHLAQVLLLGKLSACPGFSTGHIDILYMPGMNVGRESCEAALLLVTVCLHVLPGLASLQVQHMYTSTSDMATNMYISLALSSYGLACVVSLLCIAVDGMLSLHVRMRDGIAEMLCPPPPSMHPQVYETQYNILLQQMYW